GAFDDLGEYPPWVDAAVCEEYELAQLLATCDRASLDGLVRTHFPAYRACLDGFEAWVENFDRFWRYRQQTNRNAICKTAQATGREDILGLRVAELGARLIFADRHHAAEWETEAFPVEQVEAAIEQHTATCRREAVNARRKGAHESLIQAREQRQADALET